jgi:RNA polymerase sigma factor (sigma-70 family)
LSSALLRRLFTFGWKLRVSTAAEVVLFCIATCHLFEVGGDYARATMSSTASDVTDAELVRRSLAGESVAFAELVEKHQRLVFGVALSNTRDANEAEDVAQEAFVEAWRELRTLRDPKRVGTWIAGIARNLAHRWRRRAARRQKRESAAAEVDIETPPTPLDVAFERETAVLVRSGLSEIAEAYREALVLYYVHGRSVSEVAAGLGLSEDLVKQRLSRGRRALRASLERRVEDALGQLKPSTAFTATVMVAVTTASARTAGAAGSAATSGKALLAMKTTKLVVGVVLVLAAAIAWHWRSSSPSSPERHGSETGSALTASDPVTRPAAVARGSGPPAVRRLANREIRDQLVLAIRAAHEQRVSKVSKSASASVSSPRTQSGSAVGDADTSDPDADYIRESMSALLPMVVDCYKQARVIHPALAGTLVVNFTIEGEPGIGGLVTESAIDPEKSEIKDSELGQCVQETMFALEIDPPTNGGTVKVTFPFTFQPKD